MSGENPDQWYGYDAAGDLTADGLGNTYTYNVNGMLIASDGVQYLYDGLNQRVDKVGGTNRGDTIYFGGRPIALYSTSSYTWTDLIWAGNMMFAEVAGTQTAVPVYRLLNHLGSLVATTDGSGNVTGTNLMTPYGEALSSTTSDSFQFAGLYQDPEYGGDHAMFRNYSTEQTRWTRPDPYNGSYDLTNPQSFNRYMYVNGNPLAFADPSGLQECAPTGPAGLISCFLVAPTFSDADWAAASFSMFGNSAGDLTSSLSLGSFLGTALQGIGAGFAIGDFIYNFGQMAGWWGGPPQFHGNVAASQLGKNLPGVASSVPNRDVPLEYDIFHNSPQCPNCANIWHNADTTVHGLAIATGAVAATPFAAPAFASAAPYAARGMQVGMQLMQELALNPSTWTNVGDFLEGATPASLVPATSAGFAGQVASYYWDNNNW